MKEQTLPAFPGGVASDPELPTVASDPELPTVHAQLLVFARELGELHKTERQHSAQLEEVLAVLQDTVLATIKVLAQVVEVKDLATHGHLERAQAYGLALAERIDPSLAESPDITYGFFLHDIGKVGIPESILCKAGPLLPAEWQVMRTHPGIGAQIVEPIRFLGSAVEVIRHHHEWFDGSGYPSGLRGEQIPLPARIFALADSFDAMTSDRPYRGALPFEVAMGEIEAGAGTQFDPDLVEVFIDLMDEDPALASLPSAAHACTGVFLPPAVLPAVAAR